MLQKNITYSSYVHDPDALQEQRLYVSDQSQFILRPEEFEC